MHKYISDVLCSPRQGNMNIIYKKAEVRLLKMAIQGDPNGISDAVTDGAYTKHPCLAVHACHILQLALTAIA